MHNVLIVGGSAQRQAWLKALLSPDCAIHHANSGAQARSALHAVGADLVLINAPLPDEFGDDLALHATQASAAGVVLFVQAAEAWAARLNAHGVLVLTAPLRRALVQQALTIAAATRSRLDAFQKKNRQLQRQMEDIRLINRAKLLLVQHLHMTEQQAHHFIEKQSMARRVPKNQVAEGILRSYEP